MRGADRRADVLVRGLPQRDGELRRGGLHRGSLAAFKRTARRRVLIAYDRDEAGENAPRRSWPTS